MSAQTTNFDLIKPAKTDPAAIAILNGDLDIIDTEMAKPPLTVNEVEPDADRNIQITTVPLADNLTTDEAQINTGTYIIRSSGGEASISNGSAMLSEVRGNTVKTGYAEESIVPTVSGNFDIDIDPATFRSYVAASGTIVLTYSSGAWSANPALYGITIDGVPTNGDSITIVYVKASLGTITVCAPTSFVSTGWNLYNHAVGYARVPNYSEEYGFMIDGYYTGLAFASTLTGTQEAITPVDGFFTVPSDGYVFVTGGNDTDTAIWMTWSDWGYEPNGGTWEAYSQTTVDLSGVMVNFPYGLMRVGNYYDEINLNTGKAYSRIERMANTEENMASVIASGLPYDVDTNYIYVVKSLATVYNISLSGDYTVNDHGTEMFLGTTVPVTASCLYGNDLKNKLRRDVVTISQQTLTDQQKAQVLDNIGAASASTVSNIGTVVTGTNETSLSIASGGWHVISSMSLSVGTWVICGGVEFPAFSEVAACSLASGTSQIDGACARATGNTTKSFSVVSIVSPTAVTTYNLRATQSSGSAKTVSKVRLRAVRII